LNRTKDIIDHFGAIYNLLECLEIATGRKRFPIVTKPGSTNKNGTHKRISLYTIDEVIAMIRKARAY